MRENKNICIMYEGSLGDAALFWDSMQQYPRIYPISDGFHIYIACKKRAHELFEVLDNERVFNYLNVSIDDVRNSFKEFCTALKTINERQYKLFIVTPCGFRAGELLTNGITAKQIVCARLPLETSMPAIWKRVIKNAYTEIFWLDASDSFASRKYARLISGLTGQHYDAKLSHFLLPEAQRLINEPYFTINVGAHDAEHRWPADRFAEIIDKIFVNYHLTVCFIGGRNEKQIVQNTISMLRITDRICNRCGETAAAELMQILQGAVFHLGNDSGPIHLAAALGTPAIAITGWHNYSSYHPYDMEVVQQDDKLPVAVFSARPTCQNCAFRKNELTNDKQYQQCCRVRALGKSELCVERIQVDRVFSAIVELLKTVDWGGCA